MLFSSLERIRGHGQIATLFRPSAFQTRDARAAQVEDANGCDASVFSLFQVLHFLRALQLLDIFSRLSLPNTYMGHSHTVATERTGQRGRPTELRKSTFANTQQISELKDSPKPEACFTVLAFILILVFCKALSRIQSSGIGRFCGSRALILSS